MIEWGMILTGIILLLCGQIAHQLMKIKKSIRKFQGNFRLKKYIKDNYLVVIINGILILVIGVINGFTGFLASGIAQVCAGYGIDSMVINFFGNSNKKL